MVILSLLSSFLELAEDTFVIYPLALNVIMKLQIYLKQASLGSERSVGKTVLETPSGVRDSACVRSSSSLFSLHRFCSVCRRCNLTQSSQCFLSCHWFIIFFEEFGHLSDLAVFEPFLTSERSAWLVLCLGQASSAPGRFVNRSRSVLYPRA